MTSSDIVEVIGKLEILDEKDFEIFIDQLLHPVHMKTEEKPIILFMGDSGVGKSTMIKQLTQVHDDIIVGKGTEGTIDFFGVEDTRVIWLDARGQKGSESYEEYYHRMLDWGEIRVFNLESGVIEYFALDMSKIAYCVVVVPCLGPNDRHYGESADYQNNYNYVKAMFEVQKFPFSIILSKKDQVRNVSEYEMRKYYIEELFSQENIFDIDSNQYVGLQTNSYRGPTIEISANPGFQSLDNGCPWGPKEDLHPDSHFYTSKFSIFAYCQNCLYYIVLPEYENHINANEIRQTIEKLKERGYKQKQSQKAEPQGINELREKILDECLSQFSAHVISILYKRYEDRFSHCPDLIEKHVKNIHDFSHCAQIDELMCAEIISLFDFHVTAENHSILEKATWEKYSPSWISVVTGIALRILEGVPSKEVQNYLRAWGIYYSLKYYDLFAKFRQLSEDSNSLLNKLNEIRLNDEANSSAVEINKMIKKEIYDQLRMQVQLTLGKWDYLKYQEILDELDTSDIGEVYRKYGMKYTTTTETILL